MGLRTVAGQVSLLLAGSAAREWVAIVQAVPSGDMRPGPGGGGGSLTRSWWPRHDGSRPRPPNFGSSRQGGGRGTRGPGQDGQPQGRELVAVRVTETSNRSPTVRASAPANFGGGFGGGPSNAGQGFGGGSRRLAEVSVAGLELGWSSRTWPRIRRSRRIPEAALAAAAR